jgi:ABC-type sugar transport system substrate-binding protein
MRSARTRTLAVILAALVAAALVLSGCPKGQAPTADTKAKGGPPPVKTLFKIVISSRPGQLNLDQREQGYRDTLKKEFPQIEVLPTIDDETKASVGQSKASAALSAHPDIAGFAGVNAVSGIGLSEAVKAAGKAEKIVIVAMDGDSGILDRIQSGVITASIAQRQYYMTYIGTKYLYGIVHGYFTKPGDPAKEGTTEVPKEIDTGTVVVDKANLAQFRTPSQGAKEELADKHPDWLKLLADRKKGEAKPGEEYVTIGISTGAEYWNATKEGLKDVCAELGVKGTFEGPQDQNPEKQASIMDTIIARKPAGILIAPGNPDMLMPYINKAMDAGIPVICIDTDAPKSKRIAYFGTSNYNAGCMGAKILGDALLKTLSSAPAAPPAK